MSSISTIRGTAIQRNKALPPDPDARALPFGLDQKSIRNQTGDAAEQSGKSWQRKANAWNLFQRNQYLGTSGESNFGEAVKKASGDYASLGAEEKGNLAALCNQVDNFPPKRTFTHQSRFGEDKRSINRKKMNTAIQAFHRSAATRCIQELRADSTDHLTTVADTALKVPGVSAIDDAVMLGKLQLRSQRQTEIQKLHDERVTLKAWSDVKGKAEAQFLEQSAMPLRPILHELVPQPSTTHHVPTFFRL